MSETKNTGGPAFPALKTTVNKSPGVYTSELEPGMTLRDFFAAKAMQAAYLLHMDGTRNVVKDAASLANEAYAVADAMLDAREQ